MAGKKKKKRYRLLRFVVKLHLVLLLAVAAGLSWYYFGGYAEEIQELSGEAHRLVSMSGPDTFRGNQTSIA